MVSVLMPVRDAAVTVGRALRSVLRSRSVELEVVCVDHGSRDATPQILRHLGRDARVRIVDGSSATDVAGALEMGRALCAGPFIARMDADDVMHPARLAADCAWLQDQPSLAAVACRTKLIPKGRSTAGLRAYVAWQNACLSQGEHARDIWIEQPVCQPATTFRAQALADLGGYHSGPFPEDYELFLRLAVAGAGIEKRPAVQHAWRQHAATSSRFDRDVLAVLKARALVARFQLKERDVYIAGAGKEGGRIARALMASGKAPAAFLDIATRRIGRVRHGVAVLDARELPSLRARAGAFIIAAIGTSGARGVVRAQLADAGFVETVDCVVVA
jgi:glycosyltransferase involved in cell wall biosynthesis